MKLHLFKIGVVAALTGLSTPLVASDAGKKSSPAPSEVAPFLESSETLLQLNRIELKGVGKDGYLAIVEKANGDRDVVLLMRNANGSLEEQARNSHIIVCKGCEGMAGSYKASVANGVIGFKDFQGSAAGGVEEDLYFRYSTKRKTWVIFRQNVATWNRDSPRKVWRSNRFSASELITLASFQSQEFGPP